MYLTKNRFGVYLICYRDDDGKEHRVSSHTRIKKAAYGKFSKFNIPKEPNRKPDYKSILAISTYPFNNSRKLSLLTYVPWFLL